MAHQLFPIADNEFLEPKEVLRRLRAEFDFVEADADAGTEHVANMLAQFRRMHAPAEIVEAHRAMLGKAIRIVVSDRDNFEDDYLLFTALPNEALFVDYCSRQHQDTATALLERVCRILRYQAKLL